MHQKVPTWTACYGWESSLSVPDNDKPSATHSKAYLHTITSTCMDLTETARREFIAWI